MDRLRQLQERREALRALADAQRAEMHDSIHAIRNNLSFVDRGLAIADGLKRKPVILGAMAAAAILILLRPRGFAKWASLALSGISMAQQAQRVVRAVMANRR